MVDEPIAIGVGDALTMDFVADSGIGKTRFIDQGAHGEWQANCFAQSRLQARNVGFGIPTRADVDIGNIRHLRIEPL